VGVELGAAVIITGLLVIGFGAAGVQALRTRTRPDTMLAQKTAMVWILWVGWEKDIDKIQRSGNEAQFKKGKESQNLVMVFHQVRANRRG
jgi:hypothetical protein